MWYASGEGGCQIDGIAGKMKLPSPDRAIVPIEKLTEYSLNPSHSEGRHKAIVFKSALGITRENAEVLLEVLYRVVRTHEAIVSSRIRYGQKYIIEFEMTHAGKTAIVRSAWIVRNGEDFPRLTSCYIP